MSLRQGASDRQEEGRTRICRAYSRLSSLKKNEEFRAVYTRGRRLSGEKLLLFMKKNGEETVRLGVSISKKQGNSVVRHRFKRVVKEVFFRHAPLLGTGLDVVVLPKKHIRYAHPSDITFRETEEALLSLIKTSNII